MQAYFGVRRSSPLWLFLFPTKEIAKAARTAALQRTAAGPRWLSPVGAAHARSAQNCRRKRWSSAQNWRMSSSPYVSIATRSGPMPKAKPLYRSGS